MKLTTLIAQARRPLRLEPLEPRLLLDAATIQALSVTPEGVWGNADSVYASLSADGSVIVFQSDAANLVPGDTNGVSDVFVFDRAAGTLQRISVNADGVEGNAASARPAISADGLYVVFQSDASNLVEGDANGVTDIFLYDRAAGVLERISLSTGGTEANGASLLATVSANGRYVAFQSDASNLVAGDTNGVTDIFVRDRQEGTTTRVSVAAGGAQGNRASSSPVISADGRIVVFRSEARNFVPGLTNPCAEIFAVDRATGVIECVSRAADGGPSNDNASLYPAVSADGRFVVFSSAASNLVPGDTNGRLDVFLRDRLTGTLERISTAADGTQGDNYSFWGSVSADGRLVTFYSYAGNLVPGDTNATLDVFLRDRAANTLTRLSVAPDGTEGNGHSYLGVVSDDGRWAVFHSYASNLAPGDVNGASDIFLCDLGPSADVPPLITLLSPAGGRVHAGDALRITWSDYDPRHEALITLYWDLDADAANNTPATQGVAWGLIASNLSASDTADAFTWTVNAPGGHEYYIGVVISDAAGATRAVSASTLHVLQAAWIELSAGMTLVYNESDLTSVKVSFAGPGAALITLIGDGLSFATKGRTVTVTGGWTAIDEVILSGTTLTTTLRVSASRGDGIATVNRVLGDTPLKALLAPCVDLVGDGIRFSGGGWIEDLRLHNVRNGADIVLPGDGSAKGVRLAAQALSDGTDLILGSGLTTLTALSWPGGALQAPWAGTVNVKGDCAADITLTGSDAKGYALGALTVGGALLDSDILLAASARKITAGMWLGGSLTAPNVESLTLKANPRIGLTGELTNVTLNLTGSDPRGYSLGTATVGGAVAGSSILAAHSVKSLSVGSLGVGSVIAVGVDPGADGYWDGDEQSGGLGARLERLNLASFVWEAQGEPLGVIADGYGAIRVNGRALTLVFNTFPIVVGDFQIRLV